MWFILIIKGVKISRAGYTANAKETGLRNETDSGPEGYKGVKNVKEGGGGSFVFSEGNRESK